MKQISYRALIKEIGTNRFWVEEFADLVVDSTTPLSHCRFLMCRFNATLREGELPRRVRITRPLEIPSTLREHSWNKMSFNPDDKGFYPYKCRMCGITGKRYGSISFITPDRKNTIYCKK
jgi:hypothetical protein